MDLPWPKLTASGFPIELCDIPVNTVPKNAPKRLKKIKQQKFASSFFFAWEEKKSNSHKKFLRFSTPHSQIWNMVDFGIDHLPFANGFQGSKSNVTGGNGSFSLPFFIGSEKKLYVRKSGNHMDVSKNRGKTTKMDGL